MVAVGEEVGWGVVPAEHGTAAFREVLGGLARRLADASEQVLLVVAGRSVELGTARVTAVDLAELGNSGPLGPLRTRRTPPGRRWPRRGSDPRTGRLVGARGVVGGGARRRQPPSRRSASPRWASPVRSPIRFAWPCAGCRSIRPPSRKRRLAWGVDTADALADEGVDLLLLAVDDLRGRRVLGAELTGADAVSALGWPGPDDGSSDAALAGIVDDERWMGDVVQLRDGLRAVRGLSGEPMAMLRGLGSPALAAAVGLLLRSAGRRTPAVLDGPGAAAAALLAREQAWECSDWWQVAPVREEALTDRVVARLQLTPLSGWAVPVEDGTSALLAADVLCAAAALLALPSTTTPAPGEPAG